MYVYVYVCMSACLSVYVCMYVSKYVCMYVNQLYTFRYIYIYVHITSHRGDIPTYGLITMPMVISRFSTPTALMETYDFGDTPEPPICTYVHICA